MTHPEAPTIVVLGGGFGGLEFCRRFHQDRARVVLIDRQNHHLFQPLLYQVATAGLAMPDIARPLRSILSSQRRVEVLMDEVRGVDLERREVLLQDRSMGYDYLVFALGAVNHYFGHSEWRQHAVGLKTLDDAMRIRSRVLDAFERAEVEEDPARRRDLTSIVVVGGGATGIEMAGALAELTKRVLARDYRVVRPEDIRIRLIEANEHILADYQPVSRRRAADALRRKGVEVILNSPVQDIQQGVVRAGGESLRAETIIWTAGVMANPVTKTLNVPVDKQGRLLVKPDFSLPGHPRAFAIGDSVFLRDAAGREVPGVAPGAMQAARHVADLIRRELDTPPGARPPVRAPFRYRDRGKMATIGRSAAVAELFGIRLSGFPAWLTWLVVHLISLIGFRSKLIVLIQWFAAYVQFRNGARILVRSGQGRSGESG